MRLCDFAITNTKPDDFLYAVPICIKGNTMPAVGDLKIDYALLKLDGHMLGNPTIEHCIKDFGDGLQSAFIRASGTVAVYGQSLTDALDKIDTCPVVSIHCTEFDNILLDVEFMLDGNVISIDLDSAEIASTDYGIGRSMVI